jgi:hypothetical protein
MSKWLKLHKTLQRINGANTLSRRVGVFSTLTNAYAIVAVGASENFYRCAYFPPVRATFHSSFGAGAATT